MNRSFGSSVCVPMAGALVFAASVLAADPYVSNVRAQQLNDGTKRVEVLYDLSGAPAGGATVSIAFSETGSPPYTITPSPLVLSGAIGTGVANGSNLLILWDAAVTLPSGTYGTSYRAAVTATDPGGGGGDIITINLPGDVTMDLVNLPAGTFMMGSPAEERGRSDNEDLHQVELTHGYFLGATEVTQAQWEAVMGSPMPTSCGSYGVGPDYPVYCVSWDDICGGTTGSDCVADSFIGRLNTFLGTNAFRLPTEAEWERAARGGTQTAFSFDTSGNPDWALVCGSFPEAEPYMWWCGDDPTPSQSNPVGSKLPNPFELYDMHGNVWEFVADWYTESLGTAPQTDPTGPTSGSLRIKRGGRWNYYASRCRSATRSTAATDSTWYYVGFRLARSE